MREAEALVNTALTEQSIGSRETGNVEKALDPRPESDNEARIDKGFDK